LLLQVDGRNIRDTKIHLGFDDIEARAFQKRRERGRIIDWVRQLGDV
jgi:hypothetical protein